MRVIFSEQCHKKIILTTYFRRWFVCGGVLRSPFAFVVQRGAAVWQRHRQVLVPQQAVTRPLQLLVQAAALLLHRLMDTAETLREPWRRLALSKPETQQARDSASQRLSKPETQQATQALSKPHRHSASHTGTQQATQALSKPHRHSASHRHSANHTHSASHTGTQQAMQALSKPRRHSASHTGTRQATQALSKPHRHSASHTDTQQATQALSKPQTLSKPHRHSASHVSTQPSHTKHSATQTLGTDTRLAASAHIFAPLQIRVHPLQLVVELAEYVLLLSLKVLLLRHSSQRHPLLRHCGHQGHSQALGTAGQDNT